MGLKYKLHMAGDDGWSDWDAPIRRGYRGMCCDCGLVHVYQFRIVDGQIQWRVRRDNRATAAARKRKKDPFPCREVS